MAKLTSNDALENDETLSTISASFHLAFSNFLCLSDAFRSLFMENKRKHSLLPFQRHLLPVSKYRCPQAMASKEQSKVFELQEKQSLHFDTPFVAPHHLFFPEKQHFPDQLL